MSKSSERLVAKNKKHKTKQKEKQTRRNVYKVRIISNSILIITKVLWTRSLLKGMKNILFFLYNSTRIAAKNGKKKTKENHLLEVDIWSRLYVPRSGTKLDDDK